MKTVEFKDRIKQYLDATGYTQLEVAKKLDMSKQTVSAWQNGRTAPYIAYFQRFYTAQ